MSQVYVSGHIPIWAGVGGGSAPLLLGWAERFPRISIRPSWSRVFIDLTGQSVPGDMIYDGEEALVTADVIRFNQATYNIMADRATTGAGGNLAVLGTNNPGEVGTLMIQEQIAYPLWLPFTNSGLKASMGTMPAGYRFAAAFLEGPDDWEGGTAPRRGRLVWHCLRQINVISGQLVLYDFDMSKVAGQSLN